ncbi:MAG: solute carrier family 23 protein, partial [Chitinophagales bacterium]
MNLDQYFKLTERQTTVRTELLAGLTTFLTMAYIIFVNPSILSETGMDKPALVATTCLIAAFATLMMGLIARVPIAMAPGMGMNAFFTYTLVLTVGITWQTALGIVFLVGLLFLVLSIIGAREKIVNAVPSSLITSISVGIGLFLLFIGTKNLGLVVGNEATLVGLGTFTPEVLIGLGGLMLMIVLTIR